MKCPVCQAKTHVLSTRKEVFRTRECYGIGKHRFATTELTGPELNALRSRAFRFDRVRALLLEEIGT
jgi:transcriptional regulator NrdR family protein